MAHLVRPGLLLGPAYPGDVPAIVDLLERAGEHCVARSRREVEDHLFEFLVARTPSGDILGTAALEICDDRAEVRSVAVRPGWRGSGVGQALVKRVLERTRAAGLSLHCVSRCPAFFEALGFRRLPLAAAPARAGARAGGLPRVALIHESWRSIPCS
jgi:amino-acid N-acetyltransferase